MRILTAIAFWACATMPVAAIEFEDCFNSSDSGSDGVVHDKAISDEELARLLESMSQGPAHRTPADRNDLEPALPSRGQLAPAAKRPAKF